MNQPSQMNKLDSLRTSILSLAKQWFSQASKRTLLEHEPTLHMYLINKLLN